MPIQLLNPYNQHPLTAAEDSLVDSDGKKFLYKNGAFRIVEDNNYTQNFGYQWNKFAGTQVDKATALDMSNIRFFAETGWDKENLEGKNILEVGSGAGRFSQIILDY